MPGTGQQFIVNRLQIIWVIRHLPSPLAAHVGSACQECLQAAGAPPVTNTRPA